MSVLDPKREAIAAAYIANGGKQSEAYKSAHPNSKAGPKSIAVEASKIFADPNMRLRVAELQAEVVSKSSVAAALTLEAHVNELLSLRDMAKKNGLIGPAIKAEELLGQLGQHYVKRVHATGDIDHNHTHGTESVSETAEWIAGLLREREKKQTAKPVSH